MTEIKVCTGSPYKVYIGNSILDRAAELSQGAIEKGRIMIVSDDRVFPLYGSRVREAFERSGYKVYEHVFANGEASKNLTTFGLILEHLCSEGFSRTDSVAALGGGVTGDTAGFAAACFQRGIKYIQIPTTLLAAVDSSVGGKTAVDLDAGKNQAGAFHQPSAVICDTDTFSTLDDMNFACGCAEAIKCGILGSSSLFGIFENGDPKADIRTIVEECVRIKKGYVQEDEFDTGARRFLNLGHTFGHAAEKLSDYTLPHGYAVSIGTAMIADASVKHGYLSENTAARIKDTLERNGLPVLCSYNKEDMVKAALHDKKIAGGKITAVMIKDIGRCCLETIDVTELEKLL